MTVSPQLRPFRLDSQQQHNCDTVYAVLRLYYNLDMHGCDSQSIILLFASLVFTFTAQPSVQRRMNG